MARLTQRKAMILEATERLMARQGYEATAIADVAKVARSSVGSVTHFFGSKAHLALAVRDSVVGDLVEAIGVALARHETDVLKTIEEVIAVYSTWRRANPARAGLMKELAVVRVEGRPPMDLFLTRLEAMVYEWAAPRIAAGHLPALPPALLLATILGPAMVLGEMVDQETQLGQDVVPWGLHVAICALDRIRLGAAGRESGPRARHRHEGPNTPGTKRDSPGRQLCLAGV